jgi:hypothetical protein
LSQETFTITLTDAQKQALTAKVTAAGVDPSGGVLPSQHGVSLSFTVSGDVVTFTVLSKPFFVTVGMIESAIEQYINS